MRRLMTVSLVVSVTFGYSALSARQAAKPPVSVDKAGLAATVTNNQRQALAPAAGQTFLWVTATASTAETFDLTKVTLVNGPSSIPLIGVSTWDGDPKAFSMIAPVHLQAGNTLQQPLEQSSSDGSSALAFTPGKTATLKISKPPVSFCLLFAVPQGFRSGQVKGLGATDLPLPALAAGR